jgi:hypothetical protein
MTTIRVKTTDLKPGMKIRDGRQFKTIAAVEAKTVRGDGEFPDFTIYTVTLEQTMYAPGRGRTNQWANFGPDDLHTINVEEAS